ncbi:PEP-CTERM sorting domain-containing protein [Massilia consociata]|uniref:PEP-CTERM sorting domain-containing protein n=1 Tax=Massilia consociata TaxID=760117 RepID=A0ABV6FMN9_9BURK
MFKQLVSNTPAVALAVAIAFAFAPAANAGVLTWNITGPGTTAATQTAAGADLTYALAGPDVYSTQSWSATAIADKAGDYSFDWTYSGFHAYFMVTAFLNASSSMGSTDSLVNAGPANCCSAPSGGFGYAGTYTFANVNAGDTLQFTFGGTNGDSDARLLGTLSLKQQEASDVPEPASAALFGLALAGLLAARRRVR